MNDNAPIFKVGDLVQLKSGGPKMTVNYLEYYDGKFVQYDCRYFNGTETNYQLIKVWAREGTLVHAVEETVVPEAKEN